MPDFVRNANSSRFGKWLDLRFSEATVWVGDFPCVFSPIFLELGPLCKALGMKGCQITSYLLEVTRVCPGSPGTMEISNILATIFFTTNEMSPEVDKVKVNVVFTSFSNYYRQEITGGGGLFFVVGVQKFLLIFMDTLRWWVSMSCGELKGHRLRLCGQAAHEGELKPLGLRDAAYYRRMASERVYVGGVVWVGKLVVFPIDPIEHNTCF